VGNYLTFKILTPCNEVIFRSVCHLALIPTLRHMRLNPLGGKKDDNNADYAEVVIK
jgi:hypothetical protein